VAKSLKFFLPLAVFIGIAAFLYRGLGMDPHTVPSPLINKPAPQFRLPRLEDPAKTLGTSDFKGKVALFNVWATWCVSCRAEHEVLMKMAKRDGILIYGLNYKDTRPEAKQWLQFYGDPYAANAFDANGRVGINWGVYGTPETFVIDRKGIIRHKVIGPITDEILHDTLLPLIKKLKSES
jgi:cytochrome c biogenesis protein CcmG/thiol:disulfide interchange protein DsbE